MTDTVYVFDKTAWRVTSAVEGKLGGCVDAIADSVGKVGTTYYICKSNKWVEASALEYDTYHWSAGKDGDSKIGGVNTNNCYVYENKVWRSGNKTDCSLNLRGCTTLRQDTVGLGSDNVWRICDNKSWRNASNIEKDTATWGSGSFNGEIRIGQINTTIYYIYESDKKSWRNATTLEKDTYDYVNNSDWFAGADGEIQKGSITDSIYVYDASAWRAADDIEKVLGGCVTAIADSVGKVGSTYYICMAREWKIATALQYDTYKRNCTEFGQIIHGNVNGDYAYFCYGEYWKHFYGNEAKTYGKLVDERDGKIYRTIEIGEQIWMAENLNYSDEKNYPSMVNRNWCYGDCEKYGRLYLWSASIDSVYWAKQNKICGDGEEPCGLPSRIQGICPKGWHLPDKSEWNDLYELNNYRVLQAKGFKLWPKATDESGFSALPAGVYDVGSFRDLESAAIFFCAAEGDDDTHKSFYLNSNKADFGWGHGKNVGFSIRCIKD